MSRTDDVLGPLLVLKQEATRIANERGFKLLHFSIDPRDTDDLPHAAMVLEWDPDHESTPDLVIVQAADALKEEQERSYKEKLEADSKEITQDLKEQLGIDEDKLRRRRGGFLD